jgi:hypothetical protein
MGRTATRRESNHEMAEKKISGPYDCVGASGCSLFDRRWHNRVHWSDRTDVWSDRTDVIVD